MGAFAAAFPALSARHAQAELCAVIRAVLPGLREEPRVIVRVAPSTVDAITSEMARHGADWADRLRIEPSETLPPGDVSITWRAGSATRDTAAIWNEIESILAPAGLLPAFVRQKETEDVH